MQIAVYNRATVPLGLDLSAFVAAMQVYVDSYIAPVWNVGGSLLETAGPVAGGYGMVFLDDADAPGALAYHDEETGIPTAKVFVRTIAKAGASLSVAASHELVEMLVDPYAMLWVPSADPKLLYAYEAADAVEADSLAIEVNGFKMSDFVYPSWFDLTAPSRKVTRYDYQCALSKPFELHSGGYAIQSNDGQYGQVYGSKAKRDEIEAEDRRGHRSEYRRGRS